ncbi:MAG: competence protein ComEA [Chloroflexota bacterium]|jgi:competence protein ComEA|nr:competence protein ComEA [Chloroflexota bacterium]
MDESAAPWRALEDPAPGVGGEASTAEPDARSHPPARVIAALATAAILILVAFWLAASNGRGTIGVEGASAVVDGAGDGPSPAAPGASTGGRGVLVVDVQGAVARPGVIHLPTGSRVGDAIAAAGGFGPRVAADRVGRELNLAALLRDGDQVVVPSRDDGGAIPGSGGAGGSGGSSGASGAPGGSGPIDLNRATASELDALPGIGPVTANKIIAAREERPFASVDDLRSRKVIGAATFDKIKDLVVVR